VGESKLPLPWEQLREAVMNDMFPASDAVLRQIEDKDGTRGLLVYLQGLVVEDRLEDHLSEPLLKQTLPETATGLLRTRKFTSLTNALQQVYYGNAVLLIEGHSEAYSFSVAGGAMRGIQEPQTESVIRGPREGFTERIDTNLALVRNKVRTPRLKFEKFQIGIETNTDVVLAYHADLAKPSVLKEVRRRLNAIDIDAVLESGYIQEFLEDRPRSPFPQLIYSERPDAIAAMLMEGRFALFVDGSPFVLTGPVTFFQMMRSPEDYYEKYTFTTFIIWLRYAFLFLALFLPAIYVATISFHHDLLPTSLLLSIAAARESIPFPALVEAFIMELSFEALREAGIRLPKTVGQAVSILGALVIGQAAVQAGIVSAPMVIIVSMTGIASFTIPRFNFGIAIRLIRFPMMLLAGALGLYGLVIGTVLLAVHLCGLQSFGMPYLSGIAPLRRRNLKDILMRAPWYRMARRPETAAKEARSRFEPEQ